MQWVCDSHLQCFSLHLPTAAIKTDESFIDLTLFKFDLLYVSDVTHLIILDR